MLLVFSLVRVDEVSVRKALLYLTDDLRKALHSRRGYLKMGKQPEPTPKN